ncbi:MAG: TIGR01777 family oxidoreductase [Flavobacteriaceae bacterium]
MKVLITGATGLIGTELMTYLLSKNYEVNFLSTDKNKLVKKHNCEGFYWNPSKGEIDSRAFEDVETIIHLAGATIAKRWTNKYKKEILESRILSAKILYNTLKTSNHSVKHFISASGTACYKQTFDVALSEKITETEYGNGFLADVVKEWEKCADLFQNLNIKVTKVRTGVVFAKNNGALLEIVKPIKLGFGAVLGKGNQMMSWIHIDDLVRLYTFILDNKLEGVYNASSPEPISNKKLTYTISQILNKKIWLPAVPEFVLKILLGEMSSLLLNSNYVDSSKIRNAGFQFQFPDINSTLKDLI